MGRLMAENDYDRLIQRLEVVEQAHGQDLTEAEREELRRIIAAWRVWQSLGIAGRALIWALMTLAGALIAWQQIKDVFR